MRVLVRGAAGILATLFVCAAVLGVSGPTRAALQKPTYAAGDRWVYVLDGSLNGFPGVNASQFGDFRFGLLGRVEVAVVGSADLVVNQTVVPTVRVDTTASGFLNGTFPVPGVGTAQVTGSFATSTSEFWEDQAYLLIQSNGTSTYRADVTLIFTMHLAVDLRVNATATIASIPPFDLDVGQNATADLGTHLEVNTTYAFAGQTTSFSNETNVSSTWQRQVLSRENVTVQAGTFDAYKLNQTLGSFPGIPGGVAGGNETAYFSNAVGFYVKRTAYANGTRVADLTLKSYSYGPSPPHGLSVTDLLLFIALPIAIAILVVVLLWRRRNVRVRDRRSPPGPSAPGGPETGEEKRAR